MTTTKAGAAAETGTTRGLVLQYLWLVGSRIVAAALQAATVLLLARWTPPSSFGQIVALLGVLVVVGALADLGLGPLLLREKSLDSTTGITARILRLNSMTSCALCLFTAAGIGVLGLYRSEEYILLLPLSIWIAAEKNGAVWLSLAIADGRTHLSAISLLLRRTVGLGIFVAFSKLIAVPLAFALGQAVASVLVNLLMRVRLRQTKSKGNGPSFRQLSRRAIPFYLNSVGAQLRNLDVAIVFAVAGSLVGGVYAVPARLTSPLRMLPTTLGPVIVRYATMGTRTAFKAIRAVSLTVMAVMTLGMAVLFIGAPTLVGYTLGNAYLPSVLPLRITCIGLVFAFAISLQTSFLQGRGLEHFVGRVGIAVSVLVLPVIALGAALYGAAGAAAAVTASFAIHSLLLAPKTAACAKTPSFENS